jgi:hypothetical protein
MHILHLGVIVKAPDVLTEAGARELLTDVLIEVKVGAQDRLAKFGEAAVAGTKLPVRDTDVTISHSDFIVTDESPAKRRLDWLLTHPNMKMIGSDVTGWLIWDTSTDKEYTGGRTAYAAIDAALRMEGA